MKKIHNVTGLKYLCITSREDYESYKGSGTRWKHHLKKHGSDITTEVLFETTDAFELATKAQEYSKLWDVARSDEWANIVPESGYDNNNKPSVWEYLTEEQRAKIKKATAMMHNPTTVIADGVEYYSISLFSKTHKLNKPKVLKYLRENSKEQYSLEEFNHTKLKRPRRRIIVVDGIEYASYKDASIAIALEYNELPDLVLSRIKSRIKQLGKTTFTSKEIIDILPYQPQVDRDIVANMKNIVNELTSNGLSMNKLAQVLLVNSHTLSSWMKSKSVPRENIYLVRLETIHRLLKGLHLYARKNVWDRKIEGTTLFQLLTSEKIDEVAVISMLTSLDVQKIG